MNVLVTCASRHDATCDIAAAIAGGLRRRGLEADAYASEAVGSLSPYDAVVLGSEVSYGHWLRPAKAFAARLASGLDARPLWLFSSEPLGTPVKPDAQAAEVRDLVGEVGAIDHRTFGGPVGEERLRPRERIVTRAVGAPTGDFGPWSEIEAFVGEIATELARPLVAATASARA
jgi:menaquinone-dependent protoporphyrinogen oxidase